MNEPYLLKGTDVEIVSKLEQLTTGSELYRASGFRVEILGANAFEISFLSTSLHIYPTPSDVCSRVYSLALARNLFTRGVREIRIDTFVAPYLERALEHVALSVPNQDSSVYVCFQAEMCKYAESAAIIRTMLAMASTRKQHVHVTVAVRHFPCGCPHDTAECHQFQPKLWALAMRDYYTACKNSEYAVIHEFIAGSGGDTSHGSAAAATDQAAKDEVAFSAECHAQVPIANWSTIGPHRIAFPAGFPYNRLQQHTSNWTPAQWQIARVLQARILVPDIKQPYFRTLVPLCGTVALPHFEALHCGVDAVPLAKKLLEHRAWSECVTLCVGETATAFNAGPRLFFDAKSRPRVSRLCVNLETANADNMRNVIQFLRNNRNVLHTLELSLASSTNLTSEAMNNLVTKHLALAPDVRHLVVSGSDSKKTAPLVSVIIRSLAHATLRELTLPIVASTSAPNRLAVLFARPNTDLPALQHLHLVFDANLRDANIEQLFPDPAVFRNERRLTGVSLTLTHPAQQAAVERLIRRLALGLPHLRSLEVRARFAFDDTDADANKVDYTIATAISESAPNLRHLERLVLDTPISPALLLNLIRVNADPTASLRLRTLCVNIQNTPTDMDGDETTALLRALAGCGGTLRELQINGEFIDECGSPSLLRQTMGSLRLSTLDLSECKLGEQLVGLALHHGPLNVSSRVCACASNVSPGMRGGRGAMEPLAHGKTRPSVRGTAYDAYAIRGRILEGLCHIASTDW